MPIRFRCVYCDKLLGIARRKAGAVVNCPQCGQPLIVPTPEPEPTAAAAAPPPVPGKLFERDDFEAMLQGDATVRTPDAPAGRRSKSSRKPKSDPLPPRPFPVERSLPAPPEAAPADEPPPRRAEAGMIMLSPGLLIVLIVVAFLLIGAAFVGGILVGRMLQ